MIGRLVSLLLLISSLLPADAVRVSKQFDAKSYPAGTFYVSRRDYPIGKFKVRIIQVKAVNDTTSTNPSYCRAWVEVREGGMELKQAYFDEIDPVGWKYGIFLPKRQPLPHYFFALKDGDYDGRLLLVGEDGSLTNLPGGSFFLTPDKRYLIGSHDSDYQSLLVVDVARRRLVIDGEKERLPSVNEWYVDKSGYFFTALDESGTPLHLNRETLVIYRLNLKNLSVTKSAMYAVRLKATRKVETVQWQETPDCTSMP